MPEPQPTLTDGTVTLRPWRDDDLDAAVAGHDEEIARWAGSERAASTAEAHRRAVERWRAGYDADRRTVDFLVEAEGRAVGHVEVRTTGDRVGELSWTLYAGQRGRGYGVRAVRMLIDYAFEDLGLSRVEAHVHAANERATRLATRAGLRREGVLRGRELLGGEAHDAVLFARLATDPPVTDPGGFRALLNSFLPRKRAISQLLVRDPDRRVLLCQLTYKRDWDLPGGVVEVGESPQLAVGREVEEELGLALPLGRLLLTDWLPPWGGWDDALCLVFDGGVHDASILDRVVREAREIRDVAFCTPDQVADRCADFTARRVAAAMANLDDAASAYAESGRPTDTG